MSDVIEKRWRAIPYSKRWSWNANAKNAGKPKGKQPKTLPLP